MVRRGVLLAVAVVCLFIASLGLGVVAADDVDEEPGIDFECDDVGVPPDDFSPPEDGNETIGWFDGYWYDEPLDINASDGLTQDELDTLSARTAARLEAMRCLTFEELPPVEIITRDEFANETEAQFESVSPETRAFDNAQFEAMLLIGSTEDSIDVRQESRSVSVGGYYNFIENEIVIISEGQDEETLQIDEEILAHELGHALQDQHFDLAQFQRDTTDLDLGKLAVIEGDVHRIEMEYLEHCEEERWSDPCVTQDEGAGNGGGEPPSWGLYFKQFQPYSDGPAFVEHIYREGDGWESVNALYDDMPDSAMFSIYPDRYDEVETEDVLIPDRSDDDWERKQLPGEPDYNEIGQAGLSAMFMDPTYDDGDITSGPVVTGDDFLNLDETGTAVNPFNPLNYDLAYTDGWRGDKLYVYTDGEETATVWTIAWATEDDTMQFVEAYEELIAYRGGELVPGYANVWEFEGDSDFDMVLAVYPDDDRLWIVTAPTLNDLTAVHSDIEMIEIDDNGADDFQPADDLFGDDDDDTAPVLPADDGEEPPNDADGDDTIVVDDGTENDDPIPGFGVLLAIAAAIGAWFVLARRAD